jgi:hypothetical protein
MEHIWWTKADARASLDEEGGIERAILALHARQTEVEQNVRDTRYRNGRGFTPADARRLSRMADQLLAKMQLRPWQEQQAKDRLQKYCGQLARTYNAQQVAEQMLHAIRRGMPDMPLNVQADWADDYGLYTLAMYLRRVYEGYDPETENVGDD